MTADQTAKPIVKYRPDIDGLRAVAVLLVLAYHIGIYRLRGGFVGVDVFFVISGYLISSIILSDLDTSRFSIASFYERRIRRIFPALFVMLFATAVLAYKFFLPSEFVDFGKSLLASTFSFSNLYFLQHSSYFDAPAAMKPLLHTWSLAVEEQFYVFLPLFLIGIRKFFPSKQRLIIIVVALLSFCVSAVGAFHNHDATFYLAHTRAWELLLGTLLAMDCFPAVSGALWRNLAASWGVASIFLAGFLFNSATPFPGAAALLPCVGAALIIAAGKTGPTLVGRALSFRPVVFVGMISYSLYLWHWPLIVFQGTDALLINGLSPKLTKVVIIFASFVLATLSWKFVEQPFRARRFGISRASVFGLASVAAGLLLILGAGILGTKGFPSRYPEEAVKVASFLENTDATTDAQYRVGSCFLTSKNVFQDFKPSVCLQESDRMRNVLLLGDSHAAQLWFGLSSVFTDVNLMQATASGCKPTLDQSHSVERKCSRLMEYIFSDYLKTHHIDTLIIAARWDGADLQPLQRTLTWVHSLGIEVVLFGPIIQYDSALPRLLATSIRSNDAAIPALHRVAYYESLDAEMSRLVLTAPGVRYISYFKMLCPQSACLEYAGAGVPLQSDYGHLTSRGSLLVATKIREAGGLN
jgi:peptidoglycan/LPS O-acetylase OafA/YrhL